MKKRFNEVYIGNCMDKVVEEFMEKCTIKVVRKPDYVTWVSSDRIEISINERPTNFLYTLLNYEHVYRYSFTDDCYVGLMDNALNVELLNIYLEKKGVSLDSITVDYVQNEE